MVMSLIIDELHFVNTDLVIDARSRLAGRLRSIWAANGRNLLFIATIASNTYDAACATFQALPWNRGRDKRQNSLSFHKLMPSLVKILPLLGYFAEPKVLLCKISMARDDQYQRYATIV